MTRRVLAAAGLVALLATGPVQAATPASPAVASTPRPCDPTEAQAIARALRLPAPLLGQIAAHVQALGAACRQPGELAASELVGSAARVGDGLFDALSPRLPELDADERAMTGELVGGLARALPGVAVRWPAAADAPLVTGVDYEALARALGAQTPGRALLAVAGGLCTPDGGPAYMRPAMLADEPACADFNRVLGPLGRLPGAWRQAPASLRARLAAPLRAAVVAMGEQAVFCREEPTARAAAGEAARLLHRLPAFGGPGTGKRIGHNFRSYGLRFGLAP